MKHPLHIQRDPEDHHWEIKKAEKHDQKELD